MRILRCPASYGRAGATPIRPVEGMEAMDKLRASFAILPLVLAFWSCGEGNGGGTDYGSAKATIAGRTFDVSNVELTFEPGEDGYFRIEGDDAAHADQDCVPGLSGGVALYGDVPSTATSLADLSGKELPFEFSGDGDDANLCFLGTNGLLGVEAGTVRFLSVQGNQVTFSFSGTFTIYDGEGGESSTPVSASGSGTAYMNH